MTHLLRFGLLAGSIVGISLSHYLTPLHLPMLHDILQRLYYIPIILAAYWYGVRGGVLASISVSVMYVPHILFQWGIHPALELEKFLEILLYNVVGGITGFLSQKEALRREELEKTAHGLEESYNKLQKQADQIIQIQEQLRKAERFSAIGELSAVLAHEIRNPLGSIRGTAEILRDDFAPGDSKYEFLDILIKETDRLNRVVEEFLGLARSQQMVREQFDVIAELREIVALTTAEADSRGIRLFMEAGGCPPIQGDREKLRQVFLNIILNGIQATSTGGFLRVTACCYPSLTAPAGIEFRFEDNGEGIAPERLQRIFDPFYTTKKGGTGLGLAITQKIIESHDGTIEVETAAGKGTTFIVRLPSRSDGATSSFSHPEMP